MPCHHLRQYPPRENRGHASGSTIANTLPKALVRPHASSGRSEPSRAILAPHDGQCHPPSIASRASVGLRKRGSSVLHLGHDLRGSRQATASTASPPAIPPIKPMTRSTREKVLMIYLRCWENATPLQMRSSYLHSFPRLRMKLYRENPAWGKPHTYKNYRGGLRPGQLAPYQRTSDAGKPHTGRGTRWTLYPLGLLHRQRRSG